MRVPSESVLDKLLGGVIVRVARWCPGGGARRFLFPVGVVSSSRRPSVGYTSHKGPSPESIRGPSDLEIFPWQVSLTPVHSPRTRWSRRLGLVAVWAGAGRLVKLFNLAVVPLVALRIVGTLSALPRGLAMLFER